MCPGFEHDKKGRSATHQLPSVVSANTFLLGIELKQHGLKVWQHIQCRLANALERDISKDADLRTVVYLDMAVLHFITCHLKAHPYVRTDKTTVTYIKCSM